MPADAALIVLDPDILAGKPVVRGTRLSVEFIIGLLAEDWTEVELIENPNVTHESILACLTHTRDLLH